MLETYLYFRVLLSMLVKRVLVDVGQSLPSVCMFVCLSVHWCSQVKTSYLANYYWSTVAQPVLFLVDRDKGHRMRPGKLSSLDQLDSELAGDYETRQLIGQAVPVVLVCMYDSDVVGVYGVLD